VWIFQRQHVGQRYQRSFHLFEQCCFWAQTLCPLVQVSRTAAA
jgi:hypothetical protein